LTFGRRAKGEGGRVGKRVERGERGGGGGSMQCGGPKGVRRPAGGHQGAGRQAFGGRYTAGKRRQRENGKRGKRGTGKNIHKKITKKHWHKAIRVAAAAVYRRQRRFPGTQKHQHGGGRQRSGVAGTLGSRQEWLFILAYRGGTRRRGLAGFINDAPGHGLRYISGSGEKSTKHRGNQKLVWG